MGEVYSNLLMTGCKMLLAEQVLPLGKWSWLCCRWRIGQGATEKVGLVMLLQEGRMPPIW